MESLEESESSQIKMYWLHEAGHYQIPWLRFALSSSLIPLTREDTTLTIHN